MTSQITQLYGVPKCHIDKLQRVKTQPPDLSLCRANFAIFNTPVLQGAPAAALGIGFLSHFVLILRFVALLTSKAIHELAPSYITDLVKIKPLNSRYRLRSNDGILLSRPNFKTLATLGAVLSLLRRLNSGTIYLWEFRMAKSVDTFKKFLQTHLFSKAFHSQLGLLTRLCSCYLFLANLF